MDEYLEIDGWSTMSLGCLIEVLTDYTANGSFEALKENVTYYTEKNYSALIRTTDLERKEFNPQRFTDEKGHNFQRKTALYGGEIVLANVGSVGKVYKVPDYDGPMTLAPNTYLVKFKKKFATDFIFQFLKSEFYIKELYKNISSTTLAAINKDNFKSIKILIPSLYSEQHKIAKILNTVDQLIEQTQALIDKYTVIKQGIMADLFTRGVDPKTKQLRPSPQDVPELYKQTELGWIPKNWTVYSLEELTTKIVDGVHKKPEYVDSGIPFITVRNLTRGYRIDFEEVSKISKTDHIDFIKRCDPREGDVLVTKDGTLGIARIVPPGLSEFSLFVSVAQLRPNVNLCKPKLIEYFFRSGTFLNQLGYLSAGSGLQHIHLEHFRKFMLAVPAMEEQKEIFDSLEVIEIKILNEKKLLGKQKKIKKGLLQDLLTGKVRVTV